MTPHCHASTLKLLTVQVAPRHVLSWLRVRARVAIRSGLALEKMLLVCVGDKRRRIKWCQRQASAPTSPCAPNAGQWFHSQRIISPMYMHMACCRSPSDHFPTAPPHAGPHPDCTAQTDRWGTAGKSGQSGQQPVGQDGQRKAGCACAGSAVRRECGVCARAAPASAAALHHMACAASQAGMCRRCSARGAPASSG